MNKERCHGCKKSITPDEIAMTKKMINRGTTRYYCFDCLAEAFDLKRQEVLEMMDYYKQMGCMLFASNRV